MTKGCWLKGLAGGTVAEAHVGYGLLTLWYLEELALTKVETVRDDVRGHLVNLGVEISYDHVVVPPRVLDRVLQLAERALEISEAVVHLEIRVRLGEREQRVERSGEHVFSLILLSADIAEDRAATMASGVLC